MAKKAMQAPQQSIQKTVSLIPVLVKEPETRSGNGIIVAETGPWISKTFGGRRASTALNPTAEWDTPGMELIGFFRGMRQDIGDYGSNLYDFATPDGEMISTWGSAILDQRMAAVAAEPGDLCRLVYLGDVETKNGQMAKQFQVDVIPKTHAAAALATLKK